MLLAAVLSVSTSLGAAQPIPNIRANGGPRVLVMPFENVARDARIVWLGEAAALLVSEDLNALGMTVISREQRIQAFERLQVPLAAALSDATVIRIGQLIGAAQVVTGTVRVEGEVLVLHARTLALDTGRVQATATESGPPAKLFATFDRLARGIGPQGAGSLPATAHPSLAAFEQFVKGVLAETSATAIKYLTASLELQPDYDRARIALWDAYTDQRDYERALAAVQAVKPDAALGRRARFRAGLSQLALKQYDNAFETFKQLNDERSTPAVLNNLGIVQLRRGSTPQTGLPAYYFQKASEADPADPDYFFNLGYSAWLDKDIQAVIYWLREVVRRNPADGEAHFVLGAALAAAGNDEAVREKELARRLSSTYREWDRRPAADPVPRGLERVKPDVELPHAQTLEKTLTSTEQRDQQELARFYLDRGRRLFEKEDDREALVELNRALYLSPYQADAHLLVGRIHLRNGRVQEAIAALKISIWSEETAAAHVWLGEAYLQSRDAAAARVEAERALTLAPESADARKLLEKAERKP